MTNNKEQRDPIVVLASKMTKREEKLLKMQIENFRIAYMEALDITIAKHKEGN